jgi:hypothetical protein
MSKPRRRYNSSLSYPWHYLEASNYIPAPANLLRERNPVFNIHGKGVRVSRRDFNEVLEIEKSFSF